MAFRIELKGNGGFSVGWPPGVRDALFGTVPVLPRNPSGLLLLVHPDDYETPLERLSVELHVKPRGYLKETLLSATRLVDSHCPRGQAHLIAELVPKTGGT